jgi:hypothetical protein
LGPFEKKVQGMHEICKYVQSSVRSKKIIQIRSKFHQKH